MSKQSKAPGTPSTPSSKLPKFLQKGRDRSRSDAFATTSSVNNNIRDSGSPDPNMLSSVSGSSSRVASNPTTSHAPSTSPPIPIPVTPRRHAIDVPELDVTHDNSFVNDDEDDFSNINDSPVVIEPTPRPGGSRLRADRAQPSLSMYGSPSSSGKIAELPNRLSGWISHAFGGSTNDLSLPSILQQASSAPSPSSPRAGGKSNPLLVAAKNGKGHLDKAMRYLLDSDATPDNATEAIWLLGFMHSATPPSPALSLNSRPSNDTNSSGSGGGRTSRTKLRGGSSDSLAPLPTPLSHSAAVQLTPKHPGQHWPREFYTDFSTRIWCTYRTQFQPIRDSALSALESEIGGAVQATSPTRRNWWGGEKGWTADTGWGCMLRTGQSLLANALLHLHLGRDWRVPSYPEQTPDFATYVQLLTWFFDTPAPQAPFSVHRMALAGKELGKDVGQWFGPSTAAGAIKTLVQMFPACGLGVAVAADSVVYESDVFSASHGPDEARHPRRHRTKQWGGNAVLVLIGLRLGLDGVNPIYYDTIKILYTFPQSVGIAGGRPSSSYYFVGSQGDNLFYLDPHHARPTVPLRPVPPRAGSPSVSSFDARPGTIPTEVEDPAAAESNAQSTGKKSKKKGDKEKERGNNLGGRRSPLSPTSTLSSGSGRSVFSGRSSMAGPMGHTLSGSSAHSSSSSSPGHVRWQTEALPPSVHHLRGGSVSPMGTPPPGVDLTPEQAHFCSAYSANELRTFHCERVRKMHLSGLDPSMLLGFLCKDERDWRDLRERVNDLKKAHKPIFSIQDEPPAWAGGGGVDADDDSFMGLESFSEDDPEDGSGDNDNDGDGDGEVDEDNEDDELFADARGSLRSASRSPSTSPDLPSDSASSKGGRKGTVYAHPGAGQGLEMPSPPGDGDFIGEDDPRTPGPGRAFPRMQMNIDNQEPDDIDDDWEVPGVPTPGASIGGSPAGRNAGLTAPDMMRSSSANSAMSTGSEISAVSARSTLSVASGRSGKSKSPSTTKRKKRREKEASYPFPVAAAEEEGGEDGEEEEARERERCETETPANQGHAASGSGVQQASRIAPMRSAIAKDGGRTQSGGVRGVPFALTAELV